MSRKDAKIVGVDTNIFLDFLLDRKNRFGAPLGEKAGKIFSRALTGEFKIVVSPWLAKQIHDEIEPEATNALFSMLESVKALIHVQYTSDDIVEAKKYSDDFDDPMHAILARRGGAKIIITRDLAGYVCCKSIIEAVLPEDF